MLAEGHRPLIARRLGLLALVVALGLASRIWPVGAVLWDKLTGDACYAAAVYLVLGVVWPQPTRRLAVIAAGLCVAIEVFQLTGIPERLATIPLARWVLGTTFGWPDLIAYLVGIALIWLADTRLSRTRATQG